MPRCAFLTLDSVGDFVIDDELLHAPLAALGWRVEGVPWRTTDTRWEGFDAVLIRTPWDYQSAPELFLQALGRIESSGTPLFNALELVRWNLHKSYLRDLGERGVAIVPTLWRGRMGPGELNALFDEAAADSLILKPAVGANADGAFWLDRDSSASRAGEVESYFAEREFLIQPFVPAVVDEGEYSLMYFGGEFSHAILKTPREQDFRVQEEHGGIIRAVRAGEELRQAGDAAMRALHAPPLQARVDLVRRPKGEGFWLMELELIEPALYFRMDPGAAERFARAFVRAFERK